MKQQVEQAMANLIVVKLSLLFQILLFCQFLGVNSFYHLLRDARGPSTATISRTIHSVCDAVISLKGEIISWPNDCSKLAAQFFELGGFPSVCGCIDGTHVKVSPPKEVEQSYVNRHHHYSLNVLAVAGPDLSFYYVNPNFAGRAHDARVLRESSLWQAFEIESNRPFPGAVLLGDSAYPLTEWLITPYAGDPEGAKGRFNSCHRTTRNIVERAFGVVKKRFYSLSTGLRVPSMEFAAKLITAAMVLHNLCVRFGDRGDEDEDEEVEPEAGQETEAEPAHQQERRRNQLLVFFQRN